jgi:hypothetical protein
VSRFREDQAENGLTSLVVVAASISIGLVREGGGLSSLTPDACPRSTLSCGRSAGWRGIWRRHAGAISSAQRHLCSGLTTVTKHMGISPARLVALATRRMPWKTDA